MGVGGEGYYQYMRSRVSFDPRTSSERLRLVLIKQADIGRCVDYYCGNDYLCAMNYIRFDGNHELAGTKDSCLKDYLGCLMDTSETPRVDEIMGLISSGNSQNNNISANDQFRINTCYEAYQLCDTARISGSSQFLSALIQEERATAEMQLMRS